MPAVLQCLSRLVGGIGDNADAPFAHRIAGLHVTQIRKSAFIANLFFSIFTSTLLSESAH